VIGGALAAYQKSRETYAGAETESRLQESARYALAILEADVRMAGYWGLTNRGDLLTVNAGGGFPAGCGRVGSLTSGTPSTGATAPTDRLPGVGWRRACGSGRADRAARQRGASRRRLQQLPPRVAHRCWS
jgi:Tfp pilus assembly protein PilW